MHVFFIKSIAFMCFIYKIAKQNPGFIKGLSRQCLLWL